MYKTDFFLVHIQTAASYVAVLLPLYLVLIGLNIFFSCSVVISCFCVTCSEKTVTFLHSLIHFFSKGSDFHCL